jgi:two-component system sensor kinase FixL
VRAVPIFNHDGTVREWIGTTTDIHDRKLAEESLRREQELSESMIETAQNIVLVLGTDGRIVRFNAYMEELSGWQVDEVRGRDWFDTFLPEHDRQPIRELFARALGGERARGNVTPIVTKGGHEREIEWYDASLTDANGELVGLLCTGQDVTERRILQREILEIAADEQRRIGQELHDGTQQQLTGLGLLAQNVATALDKLCQADGESWFSKEAGFRDRIAGTHQRATQVQNGLENAAREVNQLSRGLIPVELDGQGLMSSLTELAGSVNEVQQIACTFTSDAPIEMANNFTATHLYRIAQEAVNNALKHSRGKRIEISLSERNGVITLKVFDNGNGIDKKRENGPGMGLRIMSYRTELIGAALSIGQANGGGTEMTCTVTQS